MIQKWIRQAENGEPVWLGDVHAALAAAVGTKPFTMMLRLLGGEKRVFTLPLPEAQNEKEEQFLLSYIEAEIYNILSALGGTELCFCLQGEAQKQLAEAAIRAFEQPESSYNRIVRELRRITRFLGQAEFRFTFADKAEAETQRESCTAAGLADQLRTATQAAMHGARAGIDVGGTDIKSVLSVNGQLVAAREYDWNPAAHKTAEETIQPILSELKAMMQGSADRLESIGLSYPDVCIRSRICGGETPKTMGIRTNAAVEYEAEFAKLTGINERLAELCKAGASIRITNDGNIAAYTAALESAHSADASGIAKGCFAHAFGTSLGTGWVNAAGAIPENPLEIYDFIIDIGSWPQQAIPAEDLRSVCNENSCLPGADRYLGQASAFRYAWALAPELIHGYAEENNGLLSLPEDKRKPCLEHLMQEAEKGNPAAQEIFRQVGRAFAQVSREITRILWPEADTRCLFGRFVKRQCCFELIRAGFAELIPDITLTAADESIACSPLMKQLARLEGKTVAQFGQAVGALVFGCAAGEE